MPRTCPAYHNIPVKYNQIRLIEEVTTHTPTTHQRRKRRTELIRARLTTGTTATSMLRIKNTCHELKKDGFRPHPPTLIYRHTIPIDWRRTRLIERITNSSAAMG